MTPEQIKNSAIGWYAAFAEFILLPDCADACAGHFIV
jgi:hypothetical protein